MVKEDVGLRRGVVMFAALVAVVALQLACLPGIPPEAGAPGPAGPTGEGTDGGTGSMPDLLSDTPGLQFSTLLGGSGEDDGRALALAPDGCIYVCGQTTSLDIATPGAADTTFGGMKDAFIAKLDPTATEVLHCTYVGGSGEDLLDGITVLWDGSVLVWGETTSSDLDIVGSALSTTLHGEQDCLLAQLNANLTSVLFLSYFGGSDYDWSWGIEYGPDGSVYLCGQTDSDDLSTTPGAYCETLSGLSDGFVLKVDWSLSNVLFCTYLGGGSIDLCADLCLCPAGGLFLAGWTMSSDFPTTAGAYCETVSSSAAGFVVLMNESGGELLASTVLQGTGYDYLYSVRASANGSVFAAGQTSSGDLPTTPGGDRSLGGFRDGFVVSLSSDLSSLLYGTYLGGSDDDKAWQLTMAPDNGTLCVAGETWSADLDATPGAYDVDYHAPDGQTPSDAFLACFNVSSMDLGYMTYIGGTGADSTWTNGLFHDRLGNPLLTGATRPGGFYTTVDAHKRRVDGPRDAYLVSIDPTAVTGPPPPPLLTARAGDDRVTLNWTADLLGARMLRVQLQRYDDQAMDWEDVAIETDPLNVSHLDTGVENGVTYQYRIRAASSLGEGPWSPIVKAKPLGPPSEVPYLDLLTGAGNVTLEWGETLDTGGEPVTYIVLRGPSLGALAPWDSTNLTGLVDTDVTIGQRYHFGVVVNNSLFNSTWVTDDVVALGPPAGFNAEPKDGRVVLTWSMAEAPGPDLMGFRIHRGESASDLPSVRTIGNGSRTNTDPNRVNGVPYWYSISTYSTDGTESVLFEPARRVVPFGVPGVPRNLTASLESGFVNLTWEPPLSDNGRPVTGYAIYVNVSPAHPIWHANVSGVTSYRFHGANGVTYYFVVTAINLAGQSLWSNQDEALIIDRPGQASFLNATVTEDGILLEWGPPEHSGGSEDLSYTILRGTSPGEMLPLVGSTDGLQYLDTGPGGPVKGVPYWYHLVVNNSYFEGDLVEATATYRTVPGAPFDLVASPGPGYVMVTWYAPLDNGGAAIGGYHVLRGLSADSVVEIDFSLDPRYNDTGVVNGVTYYYRVRARTSVGMGSGSNVDSATPLGLPGPPGSLSARVEGDLVVLTWSAPSAQAVAATTGYVVYRGRTAEDLRPMGWFGVVYEYTDDEVERGNRYYYMVRATSAMGNGEPSDVVEADVPPVPQIWMGLVAAAVATVIVVGSYYWTYRRRRREAEEEAAGAEAAAVPGAAAVAVAAEPPKPLTYIVEEILVVYSDGRLVLDCARPECRTADADLMSGMLIAVQGLIQDGLQRGGALESIKYGENLVLMASGQYIHLALVIYGRPDGTFQEEVKRWVTLVEGSYAGLIEDWTGDLDALAGIEDLVMPLIERTEHLSRDDVSVELGEATVSLLSAIDFHRGYVRLKVAAVNSTRELIADAAMEFQYNHDMLRLEHVEPKTLKVRGDRVYLGSIRPGERIAVAFMFDPQICQETYIDGSLIYYDTSGELKRVEMKRREADVVCPIFFTQEHANTAMLRRLIKEKLYLNDLRVFRYPETQPPEEILKIARTALGEEGIQKVREYIVEGPMYEAEVWYYAETKVKGYQMVIRLGVIEERGVLEVFAASTAMEHITGLLAEFRRELGEVLNKRYLGEVELEMDRDEGIRKDLASRDLLLNTVGDDEPEPGQAG